MSASLSVAFCIPGDLATLTGGYGYDRALIAALRGAGCFVQHVELPASFPFPSHDDLATTQNTFSSLKTDVALIDGLALGAIPPNVLAALNTPFAALVHHPLCLEHGLSKEIATALEHSERAVLHRASAIIVTSPATADVVADLFGLSRQSICVAEPGTTRPVIEQRTYDRRAVEIIAVGAIVPRKGYDVLLHALRMISNLPFRLRLIGSTMREPETAREIESLAIHSMLADRVIFAGELSGAALQAAYARADIFVSASRFEGYGMALTEAMANGLPIITTTAGAAADTVPDGCAIKIAADDAPALADALRLLISDSALRKTLSTRALAAAEHLPTWERAAAIVEAALRNSVQRAL